MGKVPGGGSGTCKGPNGRAHDKAEEGAELDMLMTVWSEVRLRRDKSGLKELSQSPQANGNPSEGLGMEKKGAKTWSRCTFLNYYSGHRGESELVAARADCTGGPGSRERGWRLAL